MQKTKVATIHVSRVLGASGKGPTTAGTGEIPNTVDGPLRVCVEKQQGSRSSGGCSLVCPGYGNGKGICSFPLTADLYTCTLT